MVKNFLQLKDNKSEAILFGAPNLTKRIIGNLDYLSPFVRPCARSLGGGFFFFLNESIPLFSVQGKTYKTEMLLNSVLFV